MFDQIEHPDPLEVIRDKGFVWWYKYVDNSPIEKLREQGLIESLEDTGISMMNGSYCYILKGNPRNVHIKTEGSLTVVKADPL